MSNGNERFVVEWLKKERYAESWPGEMMCDKRTGAILMKTTDGDIVSFDTNSRLDTHIANVENIVRKLGFTAPCIHIPNVYQYDDGVLDFLPENKVIFPYPSKFVNGSYLFEKYDVSDQYRPHTTDIIYRPDYRNIKRMLVSIDMDNYHVMNGEYVTSTLSDKSLTNGSVHFNANLYHSSNITSDDDRYADGVYVIEKYSINTYNVIEMPADKFGIYPTAITLNTFGVTGWSSTVSPEAIRRVVYSIIVVTDADF